MKFVSSKGLPANRQHNRMYEGPGQIKCMICEKRWRQGDTEPLCEVPAA